MIQTNETDTIIDEIHQTRRELADRFGGNIAAMLEDARQRQAASGRPVWQGQSETATSGKEVAPGNAGSTPAGE